MRLKRINEESQWVAYAEVETSGDCPLVQELDSMADDKKLSAYAMGFLVQLDAIPPVGPRQLGTKVYHYVDEEERIYEFKKGPYRLLCFQAEGRVIVCSHLFRKKSDKVPRAQVAQAVALRDRYLEAVANGTLKFE